MNFDSICDYWLVNDCAHGTFGVQALMRNVSWHVRLVGVGYHTQGGVIELYPNNRIIVNGDLLDTLPVMLSDGSTVSATSDGQVRVFLGPSRVVGVWDNVQAVVTKVPEDFYGQTCGDVWACRHQLRQQFCK